MSVHLLYNIVLHTVIPPFLVGYYGPRILWKGKYRRSWRPKLGMPDPSFDPNGLPRPRIWFHAVSVGESVALSPLARAIKERLPHASIIVSTGTETGRDKAGELIRDADGFLFLPLDFPSFVRRVVNRVQPDLFVLMETELWPNLIRRLKLHGTTIAVANGRISDRSFPRYRRLRGFLKSVLADIDGFFMSSELDAERIRAMGALPDRIHVTGNTKFDAALGSLPHGAEEKYREVLQLKESERVFVAGSTHPGENEIVLAAFDRISRRFPDAVLVLVPRHVEKTPEIVTHISQLGGHPPYLRSSADSGQPRDGRRVVVVDRTGELFGLYSIADVVFIGGSLVRRGGQNIIEPAAWGKPVLFGPSMEDFRDAAEILVRTGAAKEIGNCDELTEAVMRLLSDPRDAAERGRLGRDEILRNVGSAARTADALVGLLDE